MQRQTEEDRADEQERQQQQGEAIGGQRLAAREVKAEARVGEAFAQRRPASAKPSRSGGPRRRSLRAAAVRAPTRPRPLARTGGARSAPGPRGWYWLGEGERESTPGQTPTAGRRGPLASERDASHVFAPWSTSVRAYDIQKERGTTFLPHFAVIRHGVTRGRFIARFPPRHGLGRDGVSG